MKFSRDNVRTGGVGDLETTELDRRSQDGVRLHGKIKQVDMTQNPPVYRAEFGDPNDSDNYILTDWLPAGGGRAQGDVDTHYLEVGERVSMLSEGGEMATAHLMPSGIYTDDDDRRPGTQKAGVWHKKFQNGAVISYDRNSGDLMFQAKGKDIAGTATILAAGGSFVMKDNALTITFGGTTFKFSADGFEQHGGMQKHEDKDVGSTHKHSGVMSGSSLTDVPA